MGKANPKIGDTHVLGAATQTPTEFECVDHAHIPSTRNPGTFVVVPLWSGQCLGCGDYFTQMRPIAPRNRHCPGCLPPDRKGGRVSRLALEMHIMRHREAKKHDVAGVGKSEAPRPKKSKAFFTD